MGLRAGLDWRKISSPPGFDPGPSSQQSVAIPTELPGPHIYDNNLLNSSKDEKRFGQKLYRKSKRALYGQ